MPNPSMIFDVSDWIQEHIQCVAKPIEDFQPPYTTQQLDSMRVPCAQLKIMFDLIERFDLPMDWDALEKYERFSNLMF
jgi:hypothetical protein